MYDMCSAILTGPREYEKVDGHGTFDGASLRVDILADKQLNTEVCKAPRVVECWVEWIHPLTGKLINKLAGLIELGGDGVTHSPVKDVISEIPIGSASIGICRGKSENEIATALRAVQKACELEEDRRIPVSQNLSSSEETLKSEDSPPADDVDDLIDVEDRVRESTLSLDSLPASQEHVLSNTFLHTSIERDHVRFPSVHVLDIGILNTFANTEGNDSSLGAHVKYNLENSALISDNPSPSLWWDSECRVLNGRAEHRFLFESADDLKRLTERGWVMVVDRDQENSPSSTRSIGSVYIDAATLGSIFAGSIEKSLVLPVIAAHGEHVCDLELCLTHHIEPPSLRPAESALRMSVDSLEPSKHDEAAVRLQIDKIINLTSDAEQNIQCACSFMPDEVSLRSMQNWE